ncbi:DUF2255 family protein [Limosilactobacillus fermentum]|uniref:DUF2255 family protein n=1 Tax=Limosilactobacillus fermentum TaxID=1613 RepID=UPI002F26A36F
MQNKPFGPDKATFTEDNPVWEVVVDGRLYIRGGNGTALRWYVNGTKNGGHIRLGNQEYAVDYRAVSDPAEVQAVTDAYQAKYHGQYPIDMMVEDRAAQATVELVKR